MIARSLVKTLLLVASATLPLLAAPRDIAAVGGGDVVCGEVVAVDLFNQTILVAEAKGVESMPFSRWTDFVTRATDSQGHKRIQALDPTDVRTGDRLCISVDPSGATADRVEVFPARRATEMARACAK